MSEEQYSSSGLCVLTPLCGLHCGAWWPVRENHQPRRMRNRVVCDARRHTAEGTWQERWRRWEHQLYLLRSRGDILREPQGSPHCLDKQSPASSPTTGLSRGAEECYVGWAPFQSAACLSLPLSPLMYVQKVKMTVQCARRSATTPQDA